MSTDAVSGVIEVTKTVEIVMVGEVSEEMMGVIDKSKVVDMVMVGVKIGSAVCFTSS